MGLMIRLVIVFSLTAILSAFRNQPKFWGRGQSALRINQTQHVFSQILDHNNYQSGERWNQRYYAIQQYYNPQTGPVFLFICGEFICEGVPPRIAWVVDLAQKTQGLVLVPEHRFYGKSLPFGNDSLSLDKMAYLNSDLALKDLAFFIEEITVQGKHRVRKETKWIAISGSYPGALSAWFRVKYPHLVVGAIASSAVIVAIEDFKSFDQQIYTSLLKSGQYCVEAVNSSNGRVEQILWGSGGEQFKKQFKGGQKLKNQQFLFFWSDAIVAQVQYGNRVDFCEGLKGKTQDQQFGYLVENAKDHQVYEYGSAYLKNVTFALENGQGSRAWYYQSCSEFGFWQTYSDKHPMRSKRLDLSFYRQFCKDAFGIDLWPKFDRINIEYGGTNLKASNLFMANGIEDPWRWASLQQNRDSIVCRVADCDNCAHMIQLFTPSDQESPEVKKIREEQVKNVMSWLGKN